ncbi:exonuclease domain-containing protein [Streptomyces sp. NPDC002324]
MTTAQSTAERVPPQAVDHYQGLPVYEVPVPVNLFTQTQLKERRRKRAPGQKPAAYLRFQPPYRPAREVPLYRLDEAQEMRPLSALQQRQRAARRTCVLCAARSERPLPHRAHPWLPVEGRVCDACDRDREELWRRTCWRCQATFPEPELVGATRTCGGCRYTVRRSENVVRRLLHRHCPDCTVQTATRAEVEAAQAADPYGWPDEFPRLCAPCGTERRQRAEEIRKEGERRRWCELGPVREWARAVMADPQAYAVLDLETTGLHGDVRMVEIGITDAAGAMLLATFVRPGIPIPPEASAVHRITDDDVREARDFGEILPELTAALDGRQVIVWNQAFDAGVLRNELDRYHREHTPTLPGTLQDDTIHPRAEEWMAGQQWSRCAMLAYAIHAGEWSQHWNDWSFQRLNGPHRGLGDCLAVVQRIREMAERPDPF